MGHYVVNMEWLGCLNSFLTFLTQTQYIIATHNILLNHWPKLIPTVKVGLNFHNPHSVLLLKPGEVLSKSAPDLQMPYLLLCEHKIAFDPVACDLASVGADIQGPRCMSPAIPVSQLTPGNQNPICRQERHSMGHVCYMWTPQRLSTWKHVCSRGIHTRWHCLFLQPCVSCSPTAKSKVLAFASLPLPWFITITHWHVPQPEWRWSWISFIFPVGMNYKW